jgi:hypothetical protein
LKRRALLGGAALAALSAIASCGSRTGLFGPEPEGPDASLDGPVVPPPPDAARDAAVDAPLDATPCVPGQFTFQLALAQLMFVLDRSGSMAFALDFDVVPPVGVPTRWTTLHDALQASISAFDQQIQMGAKFFPAANADAFDPVAACTTSPGVDSAPALGRVSSILDVFAKTDPIGGTPTAAGLQGAASYLATTRGVARAIALATDGQPNCNPALDHFTCTCTSSSPTSCHGDPLGAYDCLDDVATVALIRSISQDQKIPVYVIGIGPREQDATLDRMAVAGGRPRAATPKYYPGTTPAEITAAFTAVRDGIARCTYITPSSPQDPDAISVVVAGAPIGRDATHTDGWDWVDQTYGQLQLFGAACDKATAANVSGTVSCADE